MRQIAEPARPSRPAIFPSLRLGLCCQFIQEPIKFRTTTAAALLKLSRAEQLKRLSDLCLGNAESLVAALRFCFAHNIGSFRVLSPIMPFKTHPVVGYRTEQLPDAQRIVGRFEECGEYARGHNIRTGFHPDQFVVLNAPDPEVLARSIADVESQAEIAEWGHADVINVHAGGGYGDKPAALERFRRNLDRLSSRARDRLTLENDDKTYTPADLLPLCKEAAIPLVYDVHHHRCLPDGRSILETTEAARATWNREPLFHISSPRDGWQGQQPQRHHDFINREDFPAQWLGWPLTVEVEAKAKEIAVAKLIEELSPVG